MAAVFYILLAWVLTVATCVALGTWVKRAIKLDASGWLDLTYCFLMGSAALSLIVFALASLRLIHKGTIYAVAILAILSAARQFPRLPRPPWHWTAIPFLLYAIFYLTHAMAPEHSPDGMSYHLGLVARYARQHGFVWFPTNMYAFLSQGAEMLFLFAFSIGRHSAAAMIHFTFVLALPILLASTYGLRGWFAGLFVFLLPVVGIDGISAYNDVALAVVIVACYQAMEQWRNTRQPAWVSVAALLAGFAFSIKYTGIIALVFLLPAWRNWPRWFLAAACALPWLMKNWLWSGNPLAPFYNAWFENPWFTAEFETNYRAFFRHYDLETPLEWLTEVFLGGPKLGGTLGPIGAILAASLFGFRNPQCRRLLLAAGFMLLLYPLNLGTRFLIPALPFLSLALFQISPRIAPAAILLGAIYAWPGVMNLHLGPSTWRLDDAPWRAALRLESEDAFLTRKSAGYVTARVIEQFVPANQTVYAASSIPESYCNRNIIVAAQSSIGVKLQQAFAAPIYEPYQPRFQYSCPTSRIEVAAYTPDTWSIVDIEPRPASAQCNRMPWDAPLLHDGNWVSRWRTWGPANKGDYCQLSGNGPYKLWGTGDQWGIVLKDCKRDLVPHTADYRAAARDFAISQSIQYLAIDRGDFSSQDMIEHPDLWGVSLVAQRGSMRLYRWNESILPRR